MRLLEYESKEILRRYGIRVPESQLVSSVRDVTLPLPLVLKAQVPCGGRKKAGLVTEAESRSELEQKIPQLLSMEIQGYRARKLLVEEKIDIQREFFLGITYDSVVKRAMAIFSLHGGIDVEDAVDTDPLGIHKGYFSVREGLYPYRAREIISSSGLSGRLLVGLGSTLSLLSKIFLDLDAVLVEVNPLVLTKSGDLMALDCHIDLDDDALYRHKGMAQKALGQDRYAGGRRRTDFEARAAEIDESDHRGVAGRVIEFEGTLGLLIGGGGASLTAFDAILHYGGRPANYCEIGGNPSVKKLADLTRHILSKPGVEKLAVIMNVVSNTRVDMVARGVIKGVLEAGRVPADTIVVFRVPGAWEEEGKKILAKYGIPFSGRTVSIDEAARLAVEKSV